MNTEINYTRENRKMCLGFDLIADTVIFTTTAEYIDKWVYSIVMELQGKSRINTC